ncbi:hypothetical protein EIN_034190 [Entamoeba invadens IP1]|uniref:EGF-like domain-containing protein n=1 Tax=Entamoeba invadens IP1 TaxID=370355 RepID=A0A0A1U1M7_ENTIV|nr:hypothetical protein EIN_034190 [Entamoeba invadens IP1]ELP86508.1 hypothetical protein EIN_034190 [Entamoeba invadens IP1]|eukprot:XP_004185854.1 hypothetical protein EIN_034190 [Entamoeba invadens IP1]
MLQFLCTMLHIAPIFAYIKSDPLSKTAYCASFNSVLSECERCIDDFILFGDECKHKSQLHCYEVQSSKCVRCDSNYNMVHGNCENRDNCTKYNTAGECTSCIDGFAYNKASNRCEDCHLINPLCNSFENGCYNCANCKRGTIKNENNICESKVLKCLDYIKDGMCHECYPGYYISGGYCLKGEVPNCYEYRSHEYLHSENSTCKKCLSGYLIDRQRNICVTCDKSCEKCEYSTMCVRCKEGYYLNGYKCEKCLSTNCVEDNYAHCNECNRECEVQSYGDGELFCSKPKHCLTYSTGHICESCLEGYILQNGNCVIDNTYCKTYNDDKTKCVECEQGSYMLSNFTCGLCDSGCITCSGHPKSCLKFNTNRCTQPYCLRCANDKDVCDLCDQEHALTVDGRCQTTMCKYLYEGIENDCIICEGVGYYPGTNVSYIFQFLPVDGKCNDSVHFFAFLVFSLILLL